MDEGDQRQAAKRRVAGLRRMSSALPGGASAREALLLPCLFLLVGALGGVHFGEAWRVPSLPALLLAVGMVAVLHRCGAPTLDRLLNASRSAFDLGGLLLVLAVAFASAQAFELTTPDSNVPRMAFHVFHALLLIAFITGIIPGDRARFMWVFGTIFLVAFAFKFVVLPSSPTEGWRRALCELLSLGLCEVRHPATGYLALGTLALYLLSLGGLLWLPEDDSDGSPADQGRSPADHDE